MKSAMSPQSKLPDVGTTIFTVIGQLSAEHNALNLSQGAPNFSCQPDEIERIHIVIIGQRRAFDFHQHVDRHAFRRYRQVRQLHQQTGAIFDRFAQPDNSAGTDFNARTAHFRQRIQTFLIAAGSVADRFCLVDGGRDVAQGTLAQLDDQLIKNYLTV